MINLKRTRAAASFVLPMATAKPRHLMNHHPPACRLALQSANMRFYGGRGDQGQKTEGGR